MNIDIVIVHYENFWKSWDRGVSMRSRETGEYINKHTKGIDRVLFVDADGQYVGSVNLTEAARLDSERTANAVRD